MAKKVDISTHLQWTCGLFAWYGPFERLEWRVDGYVWRRAAVVGGEVQEGVNKFRSPFISSVSDLDQQTDRDCVLVLGPAYPVSTIENRRPPPARALPSRDEMLAALRASSKNIKGDEEFDLLIVGGVPRVLV
jgi:hypothetical protein